MGSITEESLAALSLDDITEIIKQIELEEVAPKFNQWRNPAPYKVARGGRGAGAKTESAMGLAVQFGEAPSYFGSKVNILITREIENTIDLSSYSTVQRKIKTFGYSGWRLLKDRIENTKNGSVIRFRGLSDLTADNFRSLDDCDILIVEEAHKIGYKAWNTVLPSMRKKGCEVWVLFNRVEEVDPCYDIFVLNERKGSIVLDLQPGNIDNPWFDLGELPAKREEDYKRDPEEAAHIWEGLPRKQGANAVHSRTAVLEAQKREIDDAGIESVGVDVARFGGDKTKIVKRKGMKVIQVKELCGSDTIEVGNAVWDVANRNPMIPLKIDGGYNPGVIDYVRKLGGKVIEIDFGGAAQDKDQYANVATEMWFNLPLDLAQIPDDIDLLSQLTDRRFRYDKKDRKILEAKEAYKKRNGGKSPDYADALVLCFYEGKNNNVSDEIRNRMAAARRREDDV